MLTKEAYFCAMLLLGQVNTLRASRRSDPGYYLIDDEENEVLLPNKYVPDNLKAGKAIEVFLYKDSEDRWVATTIYPVVMLYGYAYLEMKMNSGFGSFFDWGLEKDLLVPKNQLDRKLEEGEKAVVYVYLDEKSERLVGTTKIKQTLSKEEVELKVGEEVDCLLFQENELGFLCVVNDYYQGMLYKNELSETREVGDRLTAYVNRIREDNKIDLRDRQVGLGAIDEESQRILNKIKEEGGYIKLTDKSSPELIQKHLGISKKLFKKSIGRLYKEKLITLEKDGIRLN